jgi:hypothetical protein
MAKAYQHINIALGSEILSQDRAEQGEFFNLPAPAEFGEALLINRNCQVHGLIVV